jgi:hypothetical protein
VTDRRRVAGPAEYRAAKRRLILLMLRRGEIGSELLAESQGVLRRFATPDSGIHHAPEDPAGPGEVGSAA